MILCCIPVLSNEGVFRFASRWVLFCESSSSLEERERVYPAGNELKGGRDGERVVPPFSRCA